MERPMSVRIIKQKQEQQTKHYITGEMFSSSPVLIESTLLLMPDQPLTPITSFELPQQNQPAGSSTTMNDFEPSRVTSLLEHSSISVAYRRPSSTTHRVHVPIHNASQWFNGPNMQNERSGRMEKVVASLVRRSYRPLSTYA
jgi:hypothetical protein